jgi:uncharacterized protein
MAKEVRECSAALKGAAREPLQVDEDSPPTPPDARARWLQRVLFVIGWLFVAIGAVGLVLPGLPGTIFLILAAGCFARSSPRFEAWLLDHPRLGPAVQRWRRSGAIPRPAKWIACLSMAASWLMLLATGAPAYAKAGIALILLLAAGYVVTRPDGEPGA